MILRSTQAANITDQAEVVLLDSYSVDAALLALALKLGVTVTSQVDNAIAACIAQLSPGKKTLPLAVLKAACVRMTLTCSAKPACIA